MAIDISLNTDADLGGVEKLADGLDKAADAAEKLEKQDADKLERSLDKAADAADDTSDALDDAGKAGKHLDDAADSARDLEKDLDRAEKAADQLGDSGKDIDKIEDAADDAAQEIDRDLVKALKEAAKQADATGKAAQEGFAKGFKEADTRNQGFVKGLRDSGEAQEEVLDEMTSNWGETMSSWNGSAEDAVRIIADTFGGLAGSMAIGGAVGSLFLGSVAGLISVFVQKWQDGSEQIEERNAEMYAAMLENADAYFNNEQIVERFHQQMQGGDDAPIDKKTFQLLQDSTGLTNQELSLAVADPRGKYGQQMSSVFQSQRTAVNKRQPVSGDYPESSDQYQADLEGWRAEKDAITAAEDAWTEYKGGVDSTSDSIKSSNEFLAENGLLLEENGGAARDLTTAQADSAQAFKDTKTALEDNIESYGSSKDAMTANKGELAGLVDTLAAEQEALEASGASSEELTALQESQAAQFIETASAAGLEKDEALDLAVQLGLIPESVATDIRENGADNVQNKAKGTKTAIDNIPSGKTVKVNLKGPDNWAISSVLAGIESRLRPVRVQIQPVKGRLYNEAL